MKTCSKCNVFKNLDEFYKNRRYKDGHYNQCRECHRLAVRKNWQEKKEVYRARMRAHYQLNKDKYNAKKKAYYTKRNRQTPDLTSEESRKIRELYWLARDLKAVSGQEYHVDHIKPLSKGGLHHPDNLQILPADLNFKKGARYEEST